MDGYDLAGRKELFAGGLSIIMRDRNYEQTKLDWRGKYEEYDNLEADGQSCPYGILKRLFQSVLGHRLFVVILY
jgi:hypothetical protein